MRLTEEHIQKIRELYPDHTGKDIAELIGCSKESVSVYARRLGLAHSAELLQEMKRKRTAAATASRTPETYKKIAEKMRRVRLAETTRKLSGMAQTTKCQIRLLPSKTRKYMTSIVYRCNYFRYGDPDDAVLYYDSETKRSAKVEEFAAKKYGIKFLPADDD